MTPQHIGFLHPLPGEAGGIPANPPLGLGNLVIEGGERIRTFTVLAVASSDQELKNVLMPVH